MAQSISAALRQIKQQLSTLIPEQMIEQAAREVGYRFRKSELGPAMRVHLMLLQLLAQVSLCSLRHVCNLTVSAQAICQGYQRLPLSVMLQLLTSSCRCLCKGQSVPLWHGLRVWMADGLSVLAPDTEAIRDRYGKGSNQHGPSCSYPLPKLLAMVDWASGMVLKVVTLPHARSEKMGLSRLLAPMSKGDVLLADSGLVSFAHVALMTARQVQCCIRLPAGMILSGRGTQCRRLIQKLGKDDLLVRWIKPPKRPKWMSVHQWRQLPDELVLRQVTRWVKRRGHRDGRLSVITTLIDEKAYPAEELLDLYDRRWPIEVNFRSLKSALGMKQLTCRSVEGVRKQIVCFILLYNLVRQVMATAAAAQKVSIARISFTDAAQWLLWSEPGRALAKLSIVPQRKRPSEPRVLKHGRRKYPLMNQPREQLPKQLTSFKSCSN